MKRTRLTLTIGLLCLVLTGSAIALERVSARSAEPAPLAQVPQPGVDNEACLACHSTPGMQMSLPSGEILYLTIDRETYLNSVHGQEGYACVQCHTEMREYPHSPFLAKTIRDAKLLLYQSCARCHQDKYDATLDSVHQKALAGGNKEAAICTDCHGAHDVAPPDQPRSQIPHTCERCHSEIYNLYKQSVHGSALIGEGNPDVPSCIDCHGVHNVSGPSNQPFHLFSPQICARCHTDKQLMAKYGLSTDVLDTYVADFHGTTVILFEKIAPDQETNKPVCIDCHGVHDMRKVDDPESHVIKENLLDTCQKCHPDASTNFPSAWLRHYRPSLEHFPLVYYVDLFYKIFIPTVLGGMGLFVVFDGTRRVLNRLRRENHHG
ncbi:MAG TPA: cytochrome c3 family protein [Anaerolineales bacterium]|nr:cytochrome c3 family protein [Anaerolineales bacterium]